MRHPVRVTCTACGKEFETSLRNFKLRQAMNPEHPTFYCPDCHGAAIKEGRERKLAQMTPEEREEKARQDSERAKAVWAKMDPEKRKEFGERSSAKLRQHFDSMTPEERQAEAERHSAVAKAAYAAKSDEEKADFARRAGEHATQMWANFSDEKRNAIRQKQSEGVKSYIAGLSDEEKQIRQDKLVEGYRNMSAEKKSEISKKLADIRIDNWNSMSQEERDAQMAKLHAGFDAYFADPEKSREFSRIMMDALDRMSDETKATKARKLSAAATQQWRDRDPEISERMKQDFVQNLKTWLNSPDRDNKNSLVQTFIELWKESPLSQTYHVQYEVYLKNNCVSHHWDCGIYDSHGKLRMCVDLDGPQFHGDSGDYSIFYNSLYMDTIRWKSVPDDVIPFVIPGKKVWRAFKQMEEILPMTRAEYEAYKFKECRLIPFPEQQYDHLELGRSWREFVQRRVPYEKALTVNPRGGDRILYNFHPAYYQAHYQDNISPYDAWHDDNILRELIHQNVLYQSSINSNKMLQAFAESDIGTAVRFESAALYKSIIEEHCNGFHEIFDPFTGMGGTMLAAVACGKQYSGMDISQEMVNGTVDMIKYICELEPDASIEFGVGDASINHGTFECMLTAPPSIGEVWPGTRNMIDSDDWISIMLHNYDCRKYIFIVPDTKVYTNYIVDYISDDIDESPHSRIIIIDNN